MCAAYPEIQRAEALVIETLKLEETKFRSLLERGLGDYALKPASPGT